MLGPAQSVGNYTSSVTWPFSPGSDTCYFKLALSRLTFQLFTTWTTWIQCQQCNQLRLLSLCYHARPGFIQHQRTCWKLYSILVEQSQRLFSRSQHRGVFVQDKGVGNFIQEVLNRDRPRRLLPLPSWTTRVLPLSYPSVSVRIVSWVFPSL